MSFLEVHQLTRHKDNVAILQDVSFSQRRFSRLAIAGETGAGKTSLLKCIAGLAQPDAGEILFQSQKVVGPADKLIPGHPAIAFLSQHFELPNFLRVEQVLEYANKLDQPSADAIFQVCRITHLMKRRTDQLSGGEKQRIAIARLLIGSPSLFLLDEPFSNLDAIHKQILKSVIAEIGDKLQITCILVSHIPTDMLSWADDIIVLKDGRIVQAGTPDEIYLHPANLYVAGLFGSFNSFSAAEVEGVIRSGNLKQGNVLSAPPSLQSVLVCRPEHILIVPAEQAAAASLEATVLRTHYFGSYLEVDLLYHGRTILSRTFDMSVVPGQRVSWRMETGHWVLNRP